MKEATVYKKLSDKKVRCLACQRKCEIAEGRVGFCLARKNTEGKLYSLLYGQITGIQADPIEKKPFYHFKPGSTVATIGSIGCNFRCKQCLNSWCTWGPSATRTLHDLSRLSASASTREARRDGPLLTLTSPNQIVQQVLKSGYSGIAFSYNEPVIWAEFAADIATEFKVQNSKCNVDRPFTVFVTNGSWTRETINLLAGTVATGDAKRGHRPTARNEESTGGGEASGRTRYQIVDAANIDFKGFSEKTYQKMGGVFGEIPEMAVYAQKKNIFVEITTLLIPKINDDWEEIKKMTNFIVHKLGPDTPWHLSEYDPNLAPDLEFQKIPFTPPELLQKAYDIGKSEGLKHIYIWAPHQEYFVNDTVCPKCKKTVIERAGWTPSKIYITPPNKCSFCGYILNVVL